MHEPCECVSALAAFKGEAGGLHGWKIPLKRRQTTSLPMPADVADELAKHELMDAYRARPPYQRNDYIGWINKAKRDDTRKRRIAQMLQELGQGDKYMKMPYHAKEPASSKAKQKASS
jgi:uncharacterized protein YdeI (YjbR/CyaY-like superfamily)